MRVSVNSMFGCAPSILSENGWSRLCYCPRMELLLVKLDRLGTDLKVRIRRLSNRYPTKTYEWVPYSTNVTSAVAWGYKNVPRVFCACGMWGVESQELVHLTGFSFWRLFWRFARLCKAMVWDLGSRRATDTAGWKPQNNIFKTTVWMELDAAYGAYQSISSHSSHVLSVPSKSRNGFVAAHSWKWRNQLSLGEEELTWGYYNTRWRKKLKSQVHSQFLLIFTDFYRCLRIFCPVGTVSLLFIESTTGWL